MYTNKKVLKNTHLVGFVGEIL